jgi:hypothetical protein
LLVEARSDQLAGLLELSQAPARISPGPSYLWPRKVWEESFHLAMLDRLSAAGAEPEDRRLAGTKRRRNASEFLAVLRARTDLTALVLHLPAGSLAHRYETDPSWRTTWSHFFVQGPCRDQASWRSGDRSLGVSCHDQGMLLITLRLYLENSRQVKVGCLQWLEKQNALC